MLILVAPIKTALLFKNVTAFSHWLQLYITLSLLHLWEKINSVTLSLQDITRERKVSKENRYDPSLAVCYYCFIKNNTNWFK